MDTEPDGVFGGLRDMYAAHTLFRREFCLAPDLVRDVADQDAVRAGLVCEHLDLIVALLDIHHRAADECACPAPAGPYAGVRSIDPEDRRLHRAIDQVTDLTAQWRATASALHAKALAEAIERLTLHLNDYLARHEETVLWPRAAAPAS
jgi:hypothetical protein